MTVIIGLVILVLSALAWVGQLLSVAAPRLAASMGLAEHESDVDPVFFADGCAEAIWDALSLWTLPVAATLLLAAAPSWPIFGLIGGAMFVYFAGRCIAQRIVMQRRGIRIGKPATQRVFVVFLALWGATGATMIGLASTTLLGRI